MEETNFEEMRKQIAILKTKLDNQDIVNDRMMHQVITSKVDSMIRPMIISIVCAIFVICVSPMSFHYSLGASWAYVIATDLMMIYCMVREFLFKRQLNNNALMNASLLDVAKKMADFKKAYKRYTMSNIFILMPAWVAWLLIEIFMSRSSEEAMYLVIAILVGLAIGGSIGFWMYIHIQNTASDVIKQIEE